jgi:hypothetical protein
MDDIDKKILHQESIKEKIDFYFNNKIKIHILKYNKVYMNGYIIEKINDSLYKIKDDVRGILDVFVSEIYEIDEFKEASEKGDVND